MPDASFAYVALNEGRRRFGNVTFYVDTSKVARQEKGVSFHGNPYETIHYNIYALNLHSDKAMWDQPVGTIKYCLFLEHHAINAKFTKCDNDFVEVDGKRLGVLKTCRTTDSQKLENLDCIFISDVPRIWARRLCGEFSNLGHTMTKFHSTSCLAISLFRRLSGILTFTRGPIILETACIQNVPTV